MTESTTDSERIHFMIDLNQTQKDIAFVSEDIKRRRRPLSELEYEGLMSRRAQTPAHDYADAVQETMTSVSSITSEAGEALERIAHETEAVLDKAGPLATFISNALSIVLVPIRCLRDKRLPTGDEGIKLGLCVAAIVIASLATAGIGGLVALGAFAVVSSTIALGKLFQTIRIKKATIRRTIAHATATKEELDTLTTALKSGLSNSNPTEQEREELKAKLNRLKKKTDEYILHGLKIRQRLNELNHPRKSLINLIHKATGFIFLLGTIFLLFPPSAPFGVGLMIAAGSISLTSTLIGFVATVVEKWQRRQGIPQPIAAEIIKGKRAPSNEQEEHLYNIWHPKPDSTFAQTGAHEPTTMFTSVSQLGQQQQPPSGQPEPLLQHTDDAPINKASSFLDSSAEIEKILLDTQHPTSTVKSNPQAPHSIDFDDEPNDKNQQPLTPSAVTSPPVLFKSPPTPKRSKVIKAPKPIDTDSEDEGEGEGEIDAINPTPND